MKRPRDSQRTKVYSAERTVGWSTDPKIPDLSDVKALILEVMASSFWKEHFPKVVDVELGDGRRRSSACGGPRGDTAISLKLPRAFRTKMVVLHEMAHGVQPHDTSWHGPEFCQIYLAMTYRFMGQERGDRLKAAFTKQRVSYRTTNFSLPWWSEAA